MKGLAPEVSVLLISFGLVLSLSCYLVTNLSPGGMITPGWLALVLIVQPMLAPKELMLKDEMPLMTGAVVSAWAAVVNVKSPDTARLPAASRDLTR